MRNPIALISVSAIAFLVLSAEPVAADLRDAPLAPPSRGGETLFTKLSPSETGLDLVSPIDTKHPLKRLYTAGYASGGLAIGDVDGDGRQDLLAVSGPGPNILFLQVEPWKFRPAEGIPLLDGGEDWGAGAAMVDIDNDGDLDLYITNYDRPNRLFINETTEPGKPRFMERAQEFGLDIVDASFQPAFCDYDLDGDLDVFILGYQYRDPGGRPKEPPVIEQNGTYFIQDGYEKYYGIGKDPVTGKQTFTNVGRSDYLLQSNAAQTGFRGPIRYTDVTKEAGLGDLGAGNSATWFDADGDGDPDLYIGNDFKVADQFFRNNGDGTFTDILVDSMPHTPWFSMGSDAADVNNDGLLDLLVSDMAGTTHYRSKVTMGEMQDNKWFLENTVPRQYMRNALFINTDTPRFLEAAYMAGLASSDWTWAVKMADFDNDGWVDVVLTNGSARQFNHSDLSPAQEEWYGKTEWDLWEDTDPRLEENLAFRNLGQLKFENVSEAWGLKIPTMSYACAYGDLDNDGDLDLVMTDLDQPLGVYRNDSTEGHRLRIRLKGTRSNRYGIGAVVKLLTAEGTQVRQMMPMTGFLSCNEPLLHFGLGQSSQVIQLVVEWPSGVRQSFQNLAAGRLYEIEEEGEPSPAPPKRVTPLFIPDKAITAVTHIEPKFDDYARQPLLPYRHSQLGPGMAVGDVDGDGDDDFYLSRAKGLPRAVYINEGGGRLVVRSKSPFEKDDVFEDMGSVFFDADADGDLDLYVVSGSVECEPGDATLRDRLYLNDGHGQFVRAEDALPDLRDSGSVVAPADFDRDGDLDLFVGGRVVPGQYPVTPFSRLLENRSSDGQAKFVDVTDEWAPGLKTTGLVTGGLWSDVNGDGWIDLLVTHEWGPVKLYQNDKGRLIDRTEEAGLHEWSGWWNGIAGRDLDHDGDIDYLVTNFGLNATYKASRDKPALLYYGDFDGSGTKHLVEAKYENDFCFPRRGLSCSSHAMPLVRQKLKTFHNFGMSTLEQVYSPATLQEALRLEANTLESGVLVNLGGEGTPRFRFLPLPRIGQIAPGFGICLTDFDGDGHTDGVMAQNFFGPQMETGHLDGGLSAWLRFAPKGKDDVAVGVVATKYSGISIAQDAKGAAIVDFNQDNRPDFLVSVNNGVLEGYRNLAEHLTKNRFLKVSLQGPAGNPTCVGARVRLRFHDESAHPPQTAEVGGGGSYLSQSTAPLFFGCGPDGRPQALEVTWPEGSTSRHPLEQAEGHVLLRMPSRP